MNAIKTQAVTATQVATTSVQTVVQNDTTTVAAKATTVTYAYLEQLANERQVWQDTAYRTSNEQLYVLLQKCYQIYKCMEAATEEGKSLRQGLNDYIALKAFVFTKSTHTLTKIVKCVFGADRRRVSAYSIVLRTALAQGKTVFDIPAFIRDAGGVEEIRLAKAPNAMTAKQKAQAVTDKVAASNLGVVTSQALGGLLDAGKIGANTLLIGTWQADGSIVVRTVVESDTALNAAMASVYSASKSELAKKAVEITAANDESAKQAAIANAVATALVAA